jgi:hypothetical protein
VIATDSNKQTIVSSQNHKNTMPPKGKTGGAGYAQNRRNHDRAAAEALQEMIPEEYFDETLSATDYTTEGKAMMAAKAYITALRVSKVAPSSPVSTIFPILTHPNNARPARRQDQRQRRRPSRNHLHTGRCYKHSTVPHNSSPA